MNSIKIIVCFSFFTIVSCQTEDNSKNKDVDRVPILKISDAEASKSSLKINCGCITDSLITENTTSCDTVILKSGGKLYYQFNCDSIWLTYENDKKHIIFNMTTELYAYTYRLGYQFSKEYDKYLLFRSGCPANGPCDFILINKETGKETKQLGELIYDHDSEVFHDFLIYFSDSNLNSLTLYFVDENRKERFQ